MLKRHLSGLKSICKSYKSAQPSQLHPECLAGGILHVKNPGLLGTGGPSEAALPCIREDDRISFAQT